MVLSGPGCLILIVVLISWTVSVTVSLSRGAVL